MVHTGDKKIVCCQLHISLFCALCVLIAEYLNCLIFCNQLLETKNCMMGDSTQGDFTWDFICNWQQTIFIAHVRQALIYPCLLIKTNWFLTECNKSLILTISTNSNYYPHIWKLFNSTFKPSKRWIKWQKLAT